MAASAYAALTMRPPSLRRGFSKALRSSRGRLRARILEDASNSSHWQSTTKWKSAAHKSRDQSSAAQKPHG
jgi:hypothetical protein